MVKRAAGLSSHGLADGSHDQPDVLPVSVVVGAGLVLIGVVNGGYFASAWGWALLCAGILLGIATYLTERVTLDRHSVLLLVALGGFGLWTLCSSLGRGDPAAARREAVRLAIYWVALLLVLVLSRSGRPLISGVLVASMALSGYGLAVYLFTTGGQLVDPIEGYLLFRPVGYANALGAIAGLGLSLAAGIARSIPYRNSPWLVAGASGAGAPFGAVLILTQSRAAWLGCAVGVLTVGLLCRGSLAALGPLVVSAAAAAALGWTLHADRTDHPFASDRARLVGLAVVSLSLASAHLCRFASGHPFRLPRVVVVIMALAVAVVLASVIASSKGVLQSGQRSDYWRVASGVAREHLLTGAGEGGFAQAWRTDGNGLGALNVHSVFLETLAEEGIVGLTLLLTALAMPIASFVLGRRTLCARIGLAGYLAFIVPASLDWDWEVPVASLAGLGCGAAVLAEARMGSDAPSDLIVGKRVLVSTSLVSVALGLVWLVQHPGF